jgi:hypothetical protein
MSIELTRLLRLGNVRFHDLRHTAATLMLKSGVHLYRPGSIPVRSLESPTCLGPFPRSRPDSPTTFPAPSVTPRTDPSASARWYSATPASSTPARIPPACGYALSPSSTRSGRPIPRSQMYGTACAPTVLLALTPSFCPRRSVDTPLTALAGSSGRRLWLWRP